MTRQRKTASVAVEKIARASIGRQRGVALAIVLWCLAGMSVLVGAIVLQGRGDTQLAQLHINRARAAAAGDGAIKLLLADRQPGGPGGVAVWQGSYRVGEIAVGVAAVPVPLLVDVNHADAALLARTLLRSGVTNAAEAQALADAIVQWRAPEPSLGRLPRRFETVEDLLQVGGFHRASWGALRDFLTARQDVQGQIEDGARSPRILSLLNTVSPKARARRPQLLTPLPTNALPGAAQTGVFRVDALTRQGGHVWLRRCWVDTSARGSRLPWNILRREPVRIVSAARG